MIEGTICSFVYFRNEVKHTTVSFAEEININKSIVGVL